MSSLDTDGTHHGSHRHFKPVVTVTVTFEDFKFQRRTSFYQKGQLQKHVAKKSWSGPQSEVRIMRFALRPVPRFISKSPARDRPGLSDLFSHPFPKDHL